MDRQALGTAQILRANSRDLPLADNSVDLVVTSPPYFALRSYQDGGEHYAGQIGDEPTPAEFIDSLLEVTRECVRVLKPSGSLWVNLGDKYSTGSGGQSNLTELGKRLGTGGGQKQDSAKVRSSQLAGMKPKSLIGIPWRYAIRCIDDLGLILRAEVIWSKPNGLPESVTDRVRRSHEQWFHFTLSPRYFSAVDEIREEHLTVVPGQKSTGGTGYEAHMTGRMNGSAHTLGKLPGSVWTIPTEPLQVPDHLGVDHFAAFPTEWPRRIIQGWSPAGVCVECGEGRRPVSETERTSSDALRPSYGAGRHGTNNSTLGPRGVCSTITGYVCACADLDADLPFGMYEPPTRPGVVLDPFGGTGTTAMVAKALGRRGISVDMSADYCRLAEWRTNDPKQLAKAARKPFTASAEPMDGQLDLLEGIA